jgi:hypothetical protein
MQNLQVMQAPTLEPILVRMLVLAQVQLHHLVTFHQKTW